MKGPPGKPPTPPPPLPPSGRARKVVQYEPEGSVGGSVGSSSPFKSPSPPESASANANANVNVNVNVNVPIKPAPAGFRIHEAPDAETVELKRPFDFEVFHQSQQQRDVPPAFMSDADASPDLDQTALKLPIVGADEDDLESLQTGLQTPPYPNPALQQPNTYPTPMTPVRPMPAHHYAQPQNLGPPPHRAMESSLRDQITAGLAAPPSAHLAVPGGPPSGPMPMPNQIPSGPMQASAPAPISAPHPSVPISPRTTGPGLPMDPRRTTGPGIAPPPPSAQPQGHQAPPPSQSQPQPHHRQPASIPNDPWASVPGSYPSRIERPPGDDKAGMPLGYVVASAFFLVIAFVGFGLWLAFAVISL